MSYVSNDSLWKEVKKLEGLKNTTTVDSLTIANQISFPPPKSQSDKAILIKGSYTAITLTSEQLQNVKTLAIFGHDVTVTVPMLVEKKEYVVIGWNNSIK